MTRYRWIGPGKVVEIEDAPIEANRVNVLSDIQPYKSMIDGSMITSRSYHRDHLKAHGCIEVGNEKMETRKQATTAQSRESRRRTLHQQLSNVSDREANRVLKSLREQYRR